MPGVIFPTIFAMILIKIQLRVSIFPNEICLAKSYKRFANCELRAVNLYPEMIEIQDIICDTLLYFKCCKNVLNGWHTKLKPVDNGCRQSACSHYMDQHSSSNTCNKVEIVGMFSFMYCTYSKIKCPFAFLF